MKQVKEISRIILIVALALHLMSAGSAAATVISVGNSNGQIANFTSIQAAVDAANPGDEIVVKPGVYEENIAITKGVSIVSESGNSSDTIVRAADSSQDIFSIWANGVSIKGFNIDGSDSAGIHFFGVIDCRIENNKLSNNSCGIDLYMISSRNVLDNNEISDCTDGISLGGSWYNNLSNNSISNCSNGISLFDSPNNILENNVISENIGGISLTGESNGNILTNNTVILNEELGIHIYETSDNLIYNNYFNNTVNVKSETISDTNIWNATKTEGTNIAGGPYLGGNVWARPDGPLYPVEVRDADLDGILDSQYSIDGNQFIDHLPLKELKPVTFTVNNSTGEAADFTSIQAAIDNASNGDTILIFPGIYEENVDVYVTNVTLTSESASSEDTVVRAASSLDDIFYIIADGVTIRGLNIDGPVDFPNAGIHLNGVNYCNIENNRIFTSYTGTILNASSENSSISSENTSFILNNSGSGAGFGMRLDSSSSNILGNNTVSWNGTSILLHNSAENALINNSVSGSNYGIWIDSSSNNTLDGNNLSNNLIGAYLKSSGGNVLSNSTVSNNTLSGINLWDSVGNTLSNSTASRNNVSIVLQNSSANLLDNNTVSSSNYGFWLYSSSNNNKLEGNTASNNRIGIHVNASSGNALTDNIALNSIRSGISVWNSAESKLTNNIASNSETSIFMQNSSKNIILNNTVSNSSYGMWIAFSSGNNLSENSALNNKFGLYLKNSTANRLSDNRVNSNSRYGIYLGFSRSNILNGNRIGSNSEYGLYMLESRNNSIYNNYFINANNTYLQGSNAGTSLNTTLKQAKNIVAGDYLGGNFWATPEGNGFSQTHADKNGNGICDVAYAVNNECIDYLPLAGSSNTNLS
ncbi:cell surface protein [Methanosarcina sp. MSH10X1]|uniref:right-handed parallel beta-helix repeat-containing protein n=1 Tax=Methanosarcina sp. MSH10X1 TaxID=2507075 RepID=UPI000FFBF49D|nr:NosD domain-containing protein [Methanosarcina sp. MSH10X1]RXA20460.1 cell surface protein [Methanosarcina sp. MSH10X1]